MMLSCSSVFKHLRLTTNWQDSYHFKSPRPLNFTDHAHLQVQWCPEDRGMHFS